MASPHEIYMHRCLELAKMGLGHTAPNPMVGSVLVHRGIIIGEGYHHKYGEAHAEVMAIRSVKQRELIPESTLYVNLEPCCHFGKTPPCTDLILDHNIKHVVVGTVDPFDEVAGKGVARLRSRGCTVTMGVLKQEGLRLNRRFFTFHKRKRPYIILKWAQTADGFVDVLRSPGTPVAPTWITSEKLRMLVHQWRTQEAAIMVGTQTAFKDNPRLNVRDWNGPTPLRVVIDKDLKLPQNLHLFDQNQPTLVFNDQKDAVVDQITYARIDFKSHTLDAMCLWLYKAGIQSVFVEGGSRLLQSLLNEDLWDEIRLFEGNQFFGRGIKAPEIHFQAKPQPIILGKEKLLIFEK